MTDPKKAFDPNEINRVKNEPGGLLVTIARTIWDRKQITYAQYKEMIVQHSLTMYKGTPNPLVRAKKQNQWRANHIRAVTNEKITWAVFITMLNVIKVKTMEIGLNFEFRDGEKVDLTKEVKFGDEE